MTSIVFSEPDAIFTLMSAILSPRVARQHREWLDTFLAGGDTRGSAVVEQLRVGYCLDRFAFECTIADDRDQLADVIATADILVCGRAPIDESLLAGADRLRLVQKLGTDLRGIDLEAAAARSVPVATYRRVAYRRVAEHAIGLMLALVKGMLRGDRAIRHGINASVRGVSESWAYNWPRLSLGSGLRGKTLGLLGLGEVGIEVAQLARAFEMRILYHQRRSDPRRDQEVRATYVSKQELFAQADIVDVHLPLTADSRRAVGADELALMKPTAYLVNTSRAHVIDEHALLRALEAGTIAGAALDNFWREPVPADHPLVAMDNVVLTPHIAGGAFDADATRDDVGGVLENIARVVAGRPLLNAVGGS